MKFLTHAVSLCFLLITLVSSVYAETRTFTYDANGNRTFNGIQDESDSSVAIKKNRHYEYNDANLLSRVYSKANGAECELVDFLYNYRHSLEVKIVYVQQCAPAIEYIEYFFFDPAGDVFFKTTKNGLGETIKDEEFFTVEGKLLATHNETLVKTTYYINNHLGSVIASVDENGDVIERVKYSPYGGPLSEISNENTFLGKVLERDLDMINLGARMQDPLTKQFLTPDTVVPFAVNQVRASVRGAVDQSSLTYRDISFLTNPYTYGRNSPITYADRDGNFFTPETYFDLTSAGVGAWNLGKSIAAGNVLDAAADVSGIILDLGAAVAPGIPGGAGLSLKGARETAELAARRANTVPASGLNFGKDNRKLDFLFNKNIDQSNTKSAQRARGNADRIGIANTPQNRAEVTRRFNEAYNDPSSIVPGGSNIPGRNLREFFLPGVTGTGSKIQFVEEAGKVITIIAK